MSPASPPAVQRRFPLGHGLLALLSLLAIAQPLGCGGCKRQPVLRLTYDVDLAHAYDGAPNKEAAMRQAVAIVAKRVEPIVGRSAVTVSARGEQIVVDLGAIDATQLADVKANVARSGRFEIARVDDDVDTFAAVQDADLPAGEGISLAVERVPVGVGTDGHAKLATRRYARIAARPGEGMVACRTRLERWTAGHAVPAGRRFGFEWRHEAEPSGSAAASGAWRTYLLFATPDLSGASVTDASASIGPGAVSVTVTFDAAGASRFEAVTGANVERRLAMVFDGAVVSAPVVKAKVAGGRAAITMGAGELDAQVGEARRLELLLRAGPLPAPLVPATEEKLGAPAR